MWPNGRPSSSEMLKFFERMADNIPRKEWIDIHDEKPRDRARRRFLKQLFYVAPIVITLTTFLGQSEAQPRTQVRPNLNRVQTDNKVRVSVI